MAELPAPDPDRAKPDPDRVTIRQLRILAEVLKTSDWSKAADALGMDDKHQAIRAVHRMLDALGDRTAIGRVKSGAMLPDEFIAAGENLSGALDALLEVFEGLRSAVSGKPPPRPVQVRVYAYSSMFRSFLADALTEFAQIKKRPDGVGKVTVRLVDLGRMRAGEGPGVISALERKEVDVAIAPGTDVSRKLVAQEPLYRWQLLAVVRKGHPLWEQRREHEGRWYVTGPDLARFPLVVAPKGHESREMLRRMDGSGTELDVAWESPDSDARTLVAGIENWVPIVASDGLASTSPDWPAVVVSGGGRWDVLGDGNSLYWRKGLPPAVDAAVQQLLGTIRAEVRKKIGKSTSGMLPIPQTIGDVGA